jgi:hypothetical protein
MSVDEIRLRTEEAIGLLIAGIALDRISDDDWFIEDFGPDSPSIIKPLVVGDEYRGGLRELTPVTRPVPGSGGERGRGVRRDLRSPDRCTPRSSRPDLGVEAGLHTIPRLDCQEVREGPAFASPIDFAPEQSRSRPVGGRSSAGAPKMTRHEATPKSGVGSNGGGPDACPSSCRPCHPGNSLVFEERSRIAVGVRAKSRCRETEVLHSIVAFVRKY